MYILFYIKWHVFFHKNSILYNVSLNISTGGIYIYKTAPPFLSILLSGLITFSGFQNKLSIKEIQKNNILLNYYIDEPSSEVTLLDDKVPGTGPDDF